MDPNANLAEQESLLMPIPPSSLPKNTTAAWIMTNPVRLEELRRALYNWLLRSGAAPDWDNFPTGTPLYLSWAKLYNVLN